MSTSLRMVSIVASIRQLHHSHDHIELYHAGHYFLRSPPRSRLQVWLDTHPRENWPRIFNYLHLRIRSQGNCHGLRASPKKLPLGTLELPWFLHCLCQCRWLPSGWWRKFRSQSPENIPYSATTQISEQDADHQEANPVAVGLHSRTDARFLLHHLHLLHIRHLWREPVLGAAVLVLPFTARWRVRWSRRIFEMAQIWWGWRKSASLRH